MQNILGVPQEEKALLRAFQERRKKLQMEAMQMALKASDEAQSNYGKLALNPGAFTLAGSQMHSQLAPNPRLHGFVYDTSSDNERTAVALSLLEKALGGPAGYGKPPVVESPRDLLESRLRYGSPQVYDEAAAIMRGSARSEAERINIENRLRMPDFLKPWRF